MPSTEATKKHPKKPPTSTARGVRRPPIVVRQSSIQGKGVFATRAIARGERIAEYEGERISHEEADKRYDDESMARHHTFLFSIDEHSCLDGAVNGNDSRFINHSCAPNAYSSADGDRIFIIAGRAIAKDEEILYDYAYTIESGDTLEKLQETYPCYCGAAKCRGTLADIPKKKPAVAAKRAAVTKAAPSKAKKTAPAKAKKSAGKTAPAKAKKKLARKGGTKR